MSDEPPVEQRGVTAIASLPVQELEPRLLAIREAQDRAAAIVAELEENSKSAAQLRKQFDKDRSRIEELKAAVEQHAAAVKSLAEASQGQSEAAKTGVAEASALLATAQSASKQAADLNAQTVAALESARPVVATVADDANRAAALRTQIEQDAQVTAKRSQHIEEGRVHSDEVRAQIDRLLVASQASADGANQSMEACRSRAAEADAMLAEVSATHTQARSTAQSVVELRAQAEVNANATKSLADIATAVEARVRAYEEKLSNLAVQSDERLKTIEGLLPGATSAGLASAFGTRRSSFVWQIWTWQIACVVSIIGLFLLVFGEFGGFGGLKNLPELQDIGRGLASRLPLAIPVIWLAIYAARQASLAVRLEEEYAHKEVVSRSFEGYRKQLEAISPDAAPESPVRKHCEQTLTAIGNPPGRIYDRKRSDVTPLSHITEAAPTLAADTLKALTKGA